MLNVNALIAFIGTVLVIFSVCVDFVGQSTPGFGFLQESLFVIGVILLFFGLRRLCIPSKNRWDWVFVSTYLSGLLVAGLQPSDYSVSEYNIFLGMNHFNVQDLYVNIVGFVPFGFLLMAALVVSVKIYRSIVITIAVTTGVSVFIEYLQYCCIPGRYSSGYDLLSNVVAAILGILLYLVYHWLSSEKNS